MASGDVNLPESHQQRQDQEGCLCFDFQFLPHFHSFIHSFIKHMIACLLGSPYILESFISPEKQIWSSNKNGFCRATYHMAQQDLPKDIWDPKIPRTRKWGCVLICV